jgi:hypothetical protein
MKTFFQINSPGRAYAWLLGFAVTRSVLDYIWVPIFAGMEYKIAVLFNYTIYLFTLYMAIPAMTGVLLGKIFSKPVNDRAVLRESILVWIVYPIVPVVSLISKSPPMQTIDLFRRIPTFMVSNNFLPTGMVAVIPVLIIFYTWLMTRHSEADWPRALACVLVSLLVVYLVYYQYVLRLFFYFHHIYGLLFSAGFFTLTFLLPLFPLAGRFHVAFGPHRVKLPALVLGSALICVGLMVTGLISAFKPM